MLKKLRIKFIAITMISVFIVLAALMVTINVINYISVINDADELVDLLAKNEGEFVISSNKEPFSGEKNIYDIPDGMSRETPFNTRFFTVILDKDGTVIQKNLKQIAAISEDEAVALAQKVLQKGKERGTSGVYRYRLTTDHIGNSLLIFVDFSTQKEPMMTFVYVSMIVMGVGLVAVFIFVFLISKRVLKPIGESYTRQRRFITDAGHELKTPLTIISANNEITEMETGKTESTEAISKQVVRMTSMVKNLTELAKMDELESSSFKKFSLTDAVEDVAQSFQTIFSSKDKILTVKAEEKIEYVGSENMLRRLLVLLLENASKYSLKHTEATLKRNGKQIILTVKNDAEGVKEGDLSKYFERFYRSDEARAGKEEGSGIGLSTAQEIVRIHKGKISARGTSDGKFVIQVIL